MNAATRKAIEKRKKQLAAARVGNVTNIDVMETREATKQKIIELLEKPVDDSNEKLIKPMKLAAAIESALNKNHHAPSQAYKASFRRIYMALKGEESHFRDQLRRGELAPETFANLSSEELKSKKQQEIDRELRDKEMKNAVGKQLLPENVNYIKDGRDREKWGVSRSAAAIDD